MSEIERPLALDRVGPAGVEQVVEAAAHELAPLAARLGIPAVHRLRCVFRLRRQGDSVISAEGELDAEVVQTCVVTLDDFPQAIRERFDLQFVPAGTEAPDDDLEAPDQIPYTGSAIDLGEAAAEQLALALDLYPHKPGAEDLTDEPLATPNPFAALAALRQKPS